MSLVGPRPYMDDESTYWNKRFDDFYYRYAVRPGITGLSGASAYGKDVEEPGDQS